MYLLTCCGHLRKLLSGTRVRFVFYILTREDRIFRMQNDLACLSRNYLCRTDLLCVSLLKWRSRCLRPPENFPRLSLLIFVEGRSTNGCERKTGPEKGCICSSMIYSKPECSCSRSIRIFSVLLEQPDFANSHQKPCTPHPPFGLLITILSTLSAGR